MKKINLFFIALIIGLANANAQTENPYNIFGYEGNVLKTQEEEIGRQSLFLNTNDTSQRLKTLVFNTKTQLIEYIGHNDEVYKIDSLLPTFVFRFISPDPHESNYPGFNTYNFVGNMPIRAVDQDGRDIYILFYTSGNSRGDEMFHASALTRKVDIEQSAGFDPSKDKIVILAIQDMADIQDKVNSTITTYSQKYGQTQEFSIWSHAGMDGPTGTVATSSNAVDKKQMTLEGWGQIDFNWKNNGGGTNANFFGCNTGVNQTKTYASGTSTPNIPFFFDTPIPNTSFAANISGLSNFKNVNVAGQTSSAYPSQFTNYRLNSENGTDNFINSITPLDGGVNLIKFQRTYLVGGVGLSSDLFEIRQNVANPMQLNKNGQTMGSRFQTGTNR
jgi:hypothetical protein